MLNCCICKSTAPADGALIDGSIFHRACYDTLQRDLQNSQNLERGLLASLRKPIGLGQNILMFFSTSKQQEILHEKQHLAWRLSGARDEIATRRARLREIYDVWPTYPPDWDERRDLVGDRDMHSCTQCGVGNRLHLHHKRPIHEGGTHRLDNLILLCPYCHSQAHGGIKFKEQWSPPASDEATSLQQKIANIQQALTKKRDLNFHYRKPDGSTSRRTVTPRELRKLNIAELQSLLGRRAPIDKEGRLCLFGYCHLRQEKRTFAVSRMYKITLR